MTERIMAHRLITYRKLAGLSRRGAANLLGITPTQLSEWENGKRMPSSRFLFKLEVLYQRLIGDIYGEERQSAIREIVDSRKKYGPDGLGVHTERPP